MWNAECGVKIQTRHSTVLHSTFRIPHSAFKEPPGQYQPRKVRESNPHSPQGNHVSTVARPTVSGYLPSPWTAADSNRDFQRARPASSRWTSSPFNQPGDGGSRTHTARFLKPRPLPIGLHHLQLMTRVGVEPTLLQGLSLVALPVGVPCLTWSLVIGHWSLVIGPLCRPMIND